MEEIKQISTFLQTPKNIAIFSHRNPDGDAIGSSLALAGILKERFHNVKILVPSEFPEELNWLRGSQEIIVYDRTPELAIQRVKESDLYFCLDFNSLDRIDKLGEPLLDTTKPIITIDHHLYPDPFSTVLISRNDVSSTCELVYLTLMDLGWTNNMNRNVSEALLTGIITDTGSFMYSIGAETFKVVDAIISKGADIQFVQDQLNNHIKEKKLRLLGHCLSNRMQIWPESKSGLIYLTKKDYADFTINRGDTEGIVNYLLRLDEIHLACFITEQPNIIKISLRSKGNFSVEKMAKTYFKGGGHKNAAGGSAFGRLKDTIDLLEKAIIENKEEIIHSF